MPKPLSADDIVAKYSAPPTEERELTADDIVSKYLPQQAGRTQASDIEALGVGARSALESATFGISEPAIGAIKGLVSEKPFQEAFQEDVEQRRAGKLAHPTAAATGEVGGFFLPGGLASRAGKLISKGAKALVPEKIAANAIGKIGIGAGEGVANTAAYELTRQGAEIPTGYLKPEEAPNLKETVEMGGLIGGAIPAIGAAVKGVGKVSKAAAQTFLGIRGDAVSDYLQNYEKVRNAPTVAEAKIMVDNAYNKIADDVASSRLSVDQAITAEKEVAEKLKSLETEHGKNWKQKNYDLKAELINKKTQLQNAVEAKTAELNSARVPTRVINDIDSSLDELKDLVSAESKKSYDILDVTQGTVSLSPAVKEINKMQNELHVSGPKGKAIISGSSQKTFDKLQSYKQKLKTLGNDLSPSQTKALIQQIDEDLRNFGDKLSGDYNDVGYNQLMRLRGSIDGSVKKLSPAYAQQMQIVSDLNRLRGDSIKFYGKPAGIASKMGRLNDPVLQNEREVLFRLGKTTGRDYESAVNEYLSAQAQLADKRGLIAGLPEYQEARGLVQEQRSLTRPGVQESSLEAERLQSGLLAEQEQLAAKRVQQEAVFMEAQDRMNKVKALAPASSESAINRLMSPGQKNIIELQKAFEDLGKLSDNDFIGTINAMRTDAAFEKGFQNGSRNVNLWAAMGNIGAKSAAGAMAGMGLGLGEVGAAIGAVSGAVIDQYGPRIGRTVLDQVIKFRGNPTIAKIRSMRIPKEVQDSLIAQARLAGYSLNE